jgi:hypothetical protein
VRKGNRKTVMGIVTMQMLMMDREKKKEEKKQKTEQPRKKEGRGGEEQYKDTMANIKCLFSMSSCPLPPHLNKHPHSSTL